MISKRVYCVVKEIEKEGERRTKWPKTKSISYDKKSKIDRMCNKRIRSIVEGRHSWEGGRI